MTSRRLLSIAGVLAGVLVVAGASAVSWARQGAAPVRPLVDTRQLRMQPEEAKFAGNTINVLGDPSKPGLYVIRRRFVPGETSSPHYHDQDRLVTVIKGTWWTDEGTVKRLDKTIPVKTGGFMLHPAGLRHYDGAKDEETIVQIMGMGPVRTVDVNEKGEPIGSR
jgi:quercetin dioxygenase-like cupin family protein